MSYFDQYSGIAGQAADQNGIPQNLFFGLIQTESSWNPYASPHIAGNTSVGFTQINSGAASQVGVDRFDPTQNLFGGAQYLASMPGNNWIEKLAHYYQGPNATISQAGLTYAGKVLNNAKSFGGSVLDSVTKGFNSSTLMSGAEMGLNTVIPGAGSLVDGISSIFGGPTAGGHSCDLICEIKAWFSSSGFFERIALAILAFLFILGGLYLLKGKSL